MRELNRHLVEIAIVVTLDRWPERNMISHSAAAARESKIFVIFLRIKRQCAGVSDEGVLKEALVLRLSAQTL
jgi:hypothetical protein